MSPAKNKNRKKFSNENIEHLRKWAKVFLCLVLLAGKSEHKYCDMTKNCTNDFFMVMHIDCVDEKLCCFHLRIVERSFIEHMDFTASYLPKLRSQLKALIFGGLVALRCLFALDGYEHEGTCRE